MYTNKFINFINIILQKHFKYIEYLENQGLDMLAFVKAIMQSDAILPPKGIGYKAPRRLSQRCRRKP